jgi:GalNAc-alpha-(1->4)-GalNAc-alpha-(1->3)-diNAcBac-PP-undecaprenol alpha-1,4-N-acetyl-D-galactosaminyltransferase
VKIWETLLHQNKTRIDKMRKRLCFIGQGLKAGGSEKHLVGLANYYAREGHDVSIINLFTTEIFFEIDEKIEMFWPKIQREEYNRFIYAALILPYIRRKVKKFKPDVVLSFGEWFSPFVILSTQFLKFPVFTFELMGPDISFGNLINNLRRFTYRYAKGTIVQTNIASEIIQKRTRAKNIEVVPTPLNEINAVTSVKKKQIVTVGRLSKEKGHIVLIRAFSSLSQKEWSLHIVGDGPERAKLEKEVDNLGLKHRVLFYGFKKDFDQVLGESEIFVLPSFYEGFPNALIEAMSVPLACVSSDCIAGPSDIINDGKNGLLVEPGSIEAFTFALNYLIKNPDKRNKIAIEAYKIRETLAFEKIANQYLNFIFQKNE